MKKYRFKNFIKPGLLKPQINIFLAIAMIILPACDDFIDVAPEGSIDADAFFSNSDELVFALNGVYASQRGIFGNLNYFNLIEARSDNAGQDQSDQKERVETDTFEETPGNLLMVNIWTQNYILINNANTVIARAPGVPADSDAEQALINRVVGEAKFLRAMSYFTLVNMFGDLPLRTEPTTDFDNAVLPRSSVADVYAFIASDLTEAANVLPDSYTGGAFNEVGRATRFAALALLGKVQLQNGNGAAASSALQNVIGQFSLLDDYADIHAAGNNNTAESIFEVSFNPTNQTGLGFNNALIPSSEASRLGIVAGGNGGNLPTFPTNDVQTIYEATDLRAAASFTPYDGGNATHYISKYIDLDAAGDGSDINLVLLRYADVLLMKAEADGESDASYELINQVRRRAFGQDPGAPDPTIDIDAAMPGTFLEKVMLERRREFVFENQRWLDLKRLPDSDVLTIINNHLSAEYTGVPSVVANRLIYPIPQQEIDISGGVVQQNPN
ncbi:RagB/SusD family nutrient uptake outer membrane protein [Fulvivirgaceae bacterium BMA12]|uniref:RagB/SusD family nutrient uptake outer membrane protein n=1 Tax=Agaribacillus aureus TaxID=3051825 RepID=A0ABT8L8G4_9BACT|nr:RagB/SusD family nutrient uptake outer membrane protein [Fulvivirgaceae bacterium BMA12]